MPCIREEGEASGQDTADDLGNHEAADQGEGNEEAAAVEIRIIVGMIVAVVAMVFVAVAFMWVVDVSGFVAVVFVDVAFVLVVFSVVVDMVFVVVAFMWVVDVSGGPLFVCSSIHAAANPRRPDLPVKPVTISYFLNTSIYSFLPVAGVGRVENWPRVRAWVLL